MLLIYSQYAFDVRVQMSLPKALKGAASSKLVWYHIFVFAKGAVSQEAFPCDHSWFGTCEGTSEKIFRVPIRNYIPEILKTISVFPSSVAKQLSLHHFTIGWLKKQRHISLRILLSNAHSIPKLDRVRLNSQSKDKNVKMFKISFFFSNRIFFLHHFRKGTPHF